MKIVSCVARELESLRAQVADRILKKVASESARRKLPAGTVIDFDPSRVWLVVDGELSLQYGDKAIQSLRSGEILGPWLSSATPLSLVTKEQSCELWGVSADSLNEFLMSDSEALRLWSAFQSASVSWYFSELAETRSLHAPPTPSHRSFASGEVILREGEVGREVYLLVEGAADVFVRDTKVGEVHQSEIFGALGALTDSTRTATVVATRPSKCLAFAKREFKDYIRSDSLLLEKLFEDFARALTDLNDSVLKANHTKWRNLF